MAETDNQTLPPRVYERLALCTTCFQLTGPVLSKVQRPAEHKVVWSKEEGTRKVQVHGSGDLPDYHKYCDCERESGSPLPFDYRTLWPDRGDVGSSCELCFACALELRDVSSKWSLVVCRACLPVLQHANEFAGRLLFPVGWHSIVNSCAAGRIQFAPQSPEQVLEDPQQLIAFAHLQHAGLEGMLRWRRTAVAANLREAGLLHGHTPARVPLRAVFEACERAKYPRELRAVELVRTTRPWTAPQAVPQAAPPPEVPVRRSRLSLLASLLFGRLALLMRSF